MANAEAPEISKMRIPVKSKDKDQQMRSLVNSAIALFNQGKFDEALDLSKKFADQYLDDCLDSSDIDILGALQGIVEHGTDSVLAETVSERKRQLEQLPQIGSLATFSDNYTIVDRKIIHGEPAFVANGLYPVIDNVVYIQGVHHKSFAKDIFKILDPLFQEGLDRFPVIKAKTFFLGRIPGNFWHFMFNIVSRLSYLPLLQLDSYEQFVCFGDVNTKQREVLFNMGVPNEKLLVLPADHSGHFENLTIYPCGVHSYTCDNSETGVAMYHDANAIRSIKVRISKRLGIDQDTPSEPVFIWREPVGRRELQNQDEIVRRFGFKVFDPMKHTLEEEVDILSHANLVIGSYGAGLTSILFAPKNINIIQLGIGDIDSSFYELIARALDQNFISLTGRPADEIDAGNWKEVDRANYTVDIDELVEAIHTAQPDEPLG